MTFRAFCREVSRFDGRFQHTSELLNCAPNRDFLADFKRTPVSASCWLELRAALDAKHACRGALAAGARVYREYRRLQRAGLA